MTAEPPPPQPADELRQPPVPDRSRAGYRRPATGRARAQQVLAGGREPPSEAYPTVRRRPTSLDPKELGFTPRKPVPWLGPLLLLTTGLRT
ncbi:MAG TPA: metallophosphoesterase, partial [Pilimelia sp.]|nr:metallophosphoesterase [Pilimelia sp.]